MVDLQSIIDFGKGKLLDQMVDQVLSAAKLCANVSKNFEVLCNMLTLLEPLVVEVSKWTGPTDVTRPWLQQLHEQLRRADEVVCKFKNQEMINPLKRVRTSNEIAEVTEGLRDLYGLAPVAALAAFAPALAINQRVLKEIKEEISKLRKNSCDLEFAQVTKRALNTRTGNSGSLVNTISPSGAFTEIKSQADLDRARNVNDVAAGRESEGGPSSSNAGDRDPGLQQQHAWRRMMGDFIVGGDKNVELVTEVLRRPNNNETSKWVGLWSMGGAGKTLTARRVYDSPAVQSHFAGGSFWLDVGRGPSPLSLLSQLYRQIPTQQYRVFSSEEDAKEALENTLHFIGDRVLLVLDDVWNSDVLQHLDVISDSSAVAAAGSKILVTTRNRALLNEVFAENIQIGMLSEEDSWQLFCWHAFRGEGNLSPSLKGFAIDVAKECKGLPLALKVIGATMAGKSNPKQWELDLRRLKNAVILSGEHEQQLFNRLQLSLDDLPTVHECLTDCFYYFAAFPEEQQISPSDMLGMWVADLEGIARGDAYGLLSPEDVAYGLLGHLIERSLIELHSGNPKLYHEQERLRYKIHDVLRDLIRHNLQHQREPHEMLCLYQPGMQMRRFPEEWQTSSHSIDPGILRAARISLMFNAIEELPPQPLRAHRLRVLLIGNNLGLQSLPKLFFANLAELRVLDLKHTGIQEIPGTAFQCLKNLKLLDLSHCSQLRKIPDSIKDLQNLTELHLSHCHQLHGIPEAFKHLQNLKALHLRNCRALEVIPGCIRSLTNLKIFDTFQTSIWDHEPRESTIFNFWQMPRELSLQDVGCLTALVDLNVYSGLATSFSVDFQRLKLLTHLRVFFARLQSFPDPSELTKLESLTLNCMALRDLPVGVVSLSQLTQLSLASCIALTSLPALDQLPLLKHLELGLCRNLTQLPESFGRPDAFPSLEELDMTGCTGAALPTLHPGAMPRLMVLRLVGWTQLEALPEPLQVLRTMSCLRLNGCSRLESLEPAFSDLNAFPRLEELFLTDTRIARLPAEFLNSKPKLRKLDLCRCPAQDTLPPEIANFHRLEILRGARV